MNIDEKKDKTFKGKEPDSKKTGKGNKGGKFKRGSKTQKEPKDYKNSPETFEKYKNIVAAATAVNGFTRAIGRDPLPLSYVGNPTVNACTTSVAGVASATLLPIWTSPTSGSNALNIAAKKIAADMRSLNTGSKVYEACDLLLYHLGGAEIASMIEWARSALGNIRSYDAINSYLPKTLVSAMGWDYDDLASDPYSFEAELNICIRKMAAWNFLGDFEFINKAKQVYTPVLVEGTDSTKTQFYVYRPYTTAHLTTTSDAQKAKLEYYRPNSSKFPYPMTRSAFIALINEMIDAYSQWTWTSTVSGDILKFKPDSILKWTEVSIKDDTKWIHDEDMLEQFMNMPIVKPIYLADANTRGGISEEITSGGVATNNLVLYNRAGAKMTFEPASYLTLLNHRMLRTYRNSLTDAQVMDLTVYDLGGTVTNAGTHPDLVTSLYPMAAVMAPDYAGLYACTSVVIYYGEKQSDGSFLVVSEPWSDFGYTHGDPAAGANITACRHNPVDTALCSEFHYLPTQFSVIVEYGGTTSPVSTQIVAHSDVEQFAMYDHDEEKNIAFARNAIYFGL